MRAAFVVGDRVNLIDDDRVHAPQMLAALLGGEQDVQRFGRRDQDVWRRLQHGAPLRCGRVAGPHRGPHRGAQIPTLQRQLLNLPQWRLQIFLDVVRERLQRRNVHHLGLAAEAAFDRLADQPVNADEKCGQRLARPGRRGDQHRLLRQNHGPALLLGLGRR